MKRNLTGLAGSWPRLCERWAMAWLGSSVIAHTPLRMSRVDWVRLCHVRRRIQRAALHPYGRERARERETRPPKSRVCSD